MFALDPLNPQANPAFRDVASCRRWLSQLQLTNLVSAQGTLHAQLEEFNRLPLPGRERFDTLEALRETVHAVQGDFAKRLIGKKLPLADEDIKSFLALLGLWRSMMNGYLRCLQSPAGGETSPASASALFIERSLFYCSLQLTEFLRAGCEPDIKSWQCFHALYAHAEEQGVASQPVKDQYSASGQELSCRTLYAKTLLLHRGRLLGLTRSQWQMVDRWLEQWSEAFSIDPRCTVSKGDAPPLAVDLGQARGFVSIQHATSSPTMRFMPMVPLSKLIRVKTILLQQGQTPEQLGLGNELDNRTAQDLLSRLHGAWCETRPDSLADEPREAPSAHLCYGLENSYAQIAGRPFKPLKPISLADKEAQRQIETFGRVLDSTDRIQLEQLGFLTENWLIEEDGLLQARLLRQSTAGSRLGQNQLVCVHKPDDSSVRVGITTLVSVTRTGQLYIALRYLPGTPQAVTVQAGSSGHLLSGTAAALLLPENPRLRIPASLLLPRDWFQAGRVVEITPHVGNKMTITLGVSVEKGNDYERVSFVPK